LGEPEHTPLWQSVTTLQSLLVPQAEHEPPQSVSVSVPFLVPSEQLDAWHVPAMHTPLVQSAPVVQPLPSAHLSVGAHEPPQSTSVSVPFLTMSPHVGT
jgi:hypothetical protein